MPRPKRSKIALTTRAVKPAPPKPQPKVTHARSRTATEPLNSFSEDSDGLVTRNKSTRSRRRLDESATVDAMSEAEMIMTGALPAPDEKSEASKTTSTPARDGSRHARASRNTTSSSTKASPSINTPAPTNAPVEEAQEEVVQEGESSGFGDLTFSSLGSESPAHGTRPPSAIKIGATPAHEASILALTNFKRRPRQPSLLRMVQQHTDVEDNDQSNLDDTDNFEFDDFLPHAESTPLNVRRNAPEDETRNDSGTHVSSSGSRGVKRKLSPVVQVPRSSPPFDPPSGADVESLRSSSPSLPEVLPSHEVAPEQRPESEEPFSETYAPPMSSSPIREASKPVQSPEQKVTRRRGRPSKKAPRYEESDSDETETPVKAKRATRTKAQQNISTAQLKGLLPRRRILSFRDRDEFDLDSSEITLVDSDQDELQMPNSRSRQGHGAGKLASPKAAKKAARGKKAPTAKPTRTYSRRVSSDKENATGDMNADESQEISMIERSEKLAAIRKKFQEVDKFELEFETVDVTTSSSPFR